MTRTKNASPTGGVTLLPVLHGRYEFALEVHRRLHELKPDAVAVEFPSTLQQPVLRAARRLPYLTVIHYQEREGALVYLIAEPHDAMFEAVRYGLEHDVPVYCVDLDVEGYPRVMEPMPDSYAVTRIGYQAYIDAFALQYGDRPSSSADAMRERNMCWHLRRLSSSYERPALVLGMNHYVPVKRGMETHQVRPLGRVKPRDASLASLHPESSREVLSEMPFLVRRYEEEREKGTLLYAPPDRPGLQRELVERAEALYYQHDKEEVTPVQRRVLFQFARNYAWVQGRLVPDFYKLIIAARGAVNDNFAFELWDIGSDYPFHEDQPSLPVMELSGDDLYLNRKLIRFHRRMKTLRRKLVPIPGRRRISRKDREKWRSEWLGLTICSYPPEDVAVEGFGDYAKKRAIKILSEDQSRTVPFTTSLLDGINARETARNWVLDGKIYVNENRPFRGNVGSLVIVFDEDEDPEDEQYPWKLTWLGEHDQESDMAFYATQTGSHLVGPGISQCVYGGFLLSYPPRRVYDIWEDPFFDEFEKKHERLLMAALDYSLERNVLYISSRPPVSGMYALAERMGKKIIYLPMGTFSPQVIKKMRTFHVLDGRHVRTYARSYINV